MEFSENLRSKLEMMGVIISDDIANKLKEYMSLLLEWNEKINLTAIINEEDIILKHFVDSLTILKYIDNRDNRNILCLI